MHLFLGYPNHCHGFRCFDLSTRKLLISRRVTFDETTFPYGSVAPTNPPSYDFLLDSKISPTLQHILHPNHPISATPPYHTEDTHIPTPPHLILVSLHLPLTSPLHLQTPLLLHPYPLHIICTLDIIKPIDHLNLIPSSISSIPKSHIQALKDPNWHKAMHEEYRALIANSTWVLVSCPLGANIVRSMWLFKQKVNVD